MNFLYTLNSTTITKANNHCNFKVMMSVHDIARYLQDIHIYNVT